MGKKPSKPKTVFRKKMPKKPKPNVNYKIPMKNKSGSHHVTFRLRPDGKGMSIVGNSRGRGRPRTKK